MQNVGRSWHRLGLLVPAFALAATLVPPAGAGVDGFDELTPGGWTGSAEAGGQTEATAAGGKIVINGTFAVDLAMLVPLSGSTTGQWELTDGVTGWTLTFATPAGQVNGEVGLLHSASGPITGTRSELNLGASTIQSTGTFIEAESGFSMPIEASDPFGPIALQVSGILCNDAWGEWIMSWNTMLGAEQFSPTFAGNWHALLLPPDDDQEAREQIEEVIPEIVALRQQMETVWLQPQIQGVPVVPWDTVWDLVTRAVVLVNQLNNLTLCERAQFGDDVIAEYVNALTNMMLTLGNLTMDNQILADGKVDLRDLVQLVAILSSGGAIGEGAVNAEAADFMEQRVRSDARAAADHPDAQEGDDVLAAVVISLVGGAG